MLEPDFDPEPVAVRIYSCEYIAKCKARSCLRRATMIAEKVDAAGQVELCEPHCPICDRPGAQPRVRGFRPASQRIL
jgi:hypothetical protein